MRCKLQHLIIVLVILLVLLGILHLFEYIAFPNDVYNLVNPIKERDILQHVTRDPNRKIVYNYPTSNNYTIRDIQIDVSKGLIDDWAELDKHMVVVTGFKQSEAYMGLGMIASVQSHMPLKRVIVYTLGVHPQITKQLKAMCNVVIRRFEFKNYPRMVMKTENKAWRVFALQEVLKEYGAYFYASPWVRFRAPINLLLPYMQKHNGMVFKMTPAISLYDIVHPATFPALKINLSEYKTKFSNVTAVSDQVLVVMNNSQLVNTFWRPLLECATSWECLAPKGSTTAWLGNSTSNEHTHYLDMSVINVFMYKYFGTEWTVDEKMNKMMDRVVDLTVSGKLHDYLWAHYCNPPKAEVDCSLYRSKC